MSKIFCVGAALVLIGAGTATADGPTLADDEFYVKSALIVANREPVMHNSLCNRRNPCVLASIPDEIKIELKSAKYKQGLDELSIRCHLRNCSFQNGRNIVLFSRGNGIKEFLITDGVPASGIESPLVQKKLLEIGKIVVQ